MNLSQLYDYVFGGRAIIQLDEARLTKALRKQSKADDEIEKAIEGKKGRIKSAIRNDFIFLSDPANNNPSRSSFLALLSSLQTPSADALKTILYGDEEPVEVVLHGYDDEEIKEKFSALNQQFNYFSGNEENQAKKDFVVFYKACKLNADFIECNNDPDNSLASDLAYKMLVLFGAAHKRKQSLFANVNTYLRQHGKGDKPVHDALVQSIPLNDPPLQDLPGWRKFIQRYGAKGLEFFQEAPDIERLLNGKAPETKKAAQQAASQISYPRANEYPKLARLCKQYHLNEETFNRCLEIEKRRKSSDKLPNISIDGNEAGHPGYHLLKLPIDDPRTYILGHITNCCQSMGGHSEQCVIDGITRENSGFYVLLKGEPAAAVLKQNGHINYKDFRMIGQGYAWLSKKGNLVFDSWENLMPEQDDTVIVSLLSKFAEKATRQEAEILRVTIGRGGKTPKEFSASSLVNRPEKMMEGVQYGDSSKQALVYVNEDKINQLKLALLDKWDGSKSPLWQTKEELKAWLNSCPLSSSHDAGVIEELFLNQATADVWQDTKINDWVLSTLPEMPELFDVLHLLYQHKLLTENNLKKLGSANKVKPLLTCLLDFPLKLMSEENFKLLAENAADAGNIDYALSALHLTDPALVNNENFKLLADNAEHAIGIIEALSDLHLTVPALVNDENFKLIVDNAKSASTVSDTFLDLHGVDSSLASDENFKLLIKHSAWARRIRAGISPLLKGASVQVNNENIKFLARNGRHARDIGWALLGLHEANPALVNDGNRELIGKHVNNALSITGAISNLYKADPALVNDKNLKLLDNNAAHAGSINGALEGLHKVSPKLVNDMSFNLLVENVKQAKKVSAVLCGIYNECLEVSGATSNESPAFFNSNSPQASSSLSKPLVEKITKYLCGEREIDFNPEEIKMIKEYSWGYSTKGYVSLILPLSDAVPAKRPQ